MNGTDTSASLYAGAMPRPSNRALTGENSLGGRISVGGFSPRAGYLTAMPHPLSLAAARTLSMLSQATQPRTTASCGASAEHASPPQSRFASISSLATAKATASRSSGNLLEIPSRSVDAIRAYSEAISRSVSESFLCISQRLSSGSGTARTPCLGFASPSPYWKSNVPSSQSRSLTPAISSLLAMAGSKSPNGMYRRIEPRSESDSPLRLSYLSLSERTSSTLSGASAARDTKWHDFAALSAMRTARSAFSRLDFAAPPAAPPCPISSRCTAPRSRRRSKVRSESSAVQSSKRCFIGTIMTAPLPHVSRERGSSLSCRALPQRSARRLWRSLSPVCSRGNPVSLPSQRDSRAATLSQALP